MVADKPKKKAVKKAAAPKAPVGRPRKKLGTRVSDLPVVSTLRPRAARSNQDSLALQRARLQYKRDYPRDTKGVDEYKSRALLDAMADASRGAIGNRVLGKAKYKLDELADALLKAKKENKKYTIQDGNVYINPDATGPIGSLIAALEGPVGPATLTSTGKRGRPASAPKVVGTTGRKTAVKIPKAAPKKPPLARRQIDEEYEETVNNAKRIAQEGEDARDAGDNATHSKLTKEATKLYNAAVTKRANRLAKRQAWEDARAAQSGSNVASSSGVTAAEKEDVPTLTTAQTTQVLGLVNDVSLNGVTPDGMRAIQSAEPAVKIAAVTALSRMVDKQEGARQDTPMTIALREAVDEMGRLADEQAAIVRAQQIASEDARMREPAQPKKRKEAAVPPVVVDPRAAAEEPLVRRPRKKPISDTEAARVREVERQQQEAADQEEEVRKETAARIAATRKARRAQQNEEADAAIERGRAIRAERAEENERKAQSSRSMYGPQIEAALAKQAAEARAEENVRKALSSRSMYGPQIEAAIAKQAAQENPRIIPLPPPPPPTTPRSGAPVSSQLSADALRERASQLRRTQTQQRNVNPLSDVVGLRSQAERLKKTETRVQEGITRRDINPLNEDILFQASQLKKREKIEPKDFTRAPVNVGPLDKALQEQALKIKNKMIERAIREETASSGISAAEAARLLEEEAEGLRLLPPPAYDELFRDTASGTTAYQIAGEKYRPTAVFRTDPNPISGDVEKRFRYNKPMQNIFKDSPGKFKEVYARPYVPALSDAERAAVGDRDLSIQQEGMTPSTSDRIIVPGTYRQALDDHPGPSVEAYGEGLVGGGRRSFTGGVLRRLRGMGFFDGFDSLSYNIHGTPDDNKKDLADAKAAYAARGGAMGGTFDGRTDFRVLMDAMKTVPRIKGGAMGGGRVFLSGVSAPTGMTGGYPIGVGADSDEYKLHYVAFPDDKWTTSSSLRWLRSNGIVPIKKAMHIPEYYKYQIMPPSDNKDYIGHELVSRGRKILLGYARPSK